MPNVDQFESVFKAAAKARYHHRSPALRRVDVVTDLDPAGAQAFTDRVRAFLPAAADGAECHTLPGEESRTVEQLLSMVERDTPDLIVTYRNLHSEAWQWPHSLGRHLDVLTQATDRPVLVVPHPRDGDRLERALEHARVVMAATDHLAGDGRLVSVGAAFTEPGGRLVLAHVEDDTTFERYIDVISKIPAIDTDVARETILAQLLKEPSDYVVACRDELARQGVDVDVVGEVGSGHRVKEYKDVIERHGVQLLVMHTRDEEQLAMHGLAFPLAVEIRHIPLLMV